jgi:hypothetical protein
VSHILGDDGNARWECRLCAAQQNDTKRAAAYLMFHQNKSFDISGAVQFHVLKITVYLLKYEKAAPIGWHKSRSNGRHVIGRVCPRFDRMVKATTRAMAVK